MREQVAESHVDRKTGERRCGRAPRGKRPVVQQRHDGGSEKHRHTLMRAIGVAALTRTAADDSKRAATAATAAIVSANRIFSGSNNAATATDFLHHQLGPLAYRQQCAFAAAHPNEYRAPDVPAALLNPPSSLEMPPSDSSSAVAPRAGGSRRRRRRKNPPKLPAPPQPASAAWITSVVSDPGTPRLTSTNTSHPASSTTDALPSTLSVSDVRALRQPGRSVVPQCLLPRRGRAATPDVASLNPTRQPALHYSQSALPPPPPVVVLMDNWAGHHSRLFQHAVRTHWSKTVRIVFVPPYSPDLNWPIECSFHDVKSRLRRDRLALPLVTRRPTPAASTSAGPLTAAELATTVRSVDSLDSHAAALTLMRRARRAGYALRESTWLSAEFDRISPALFS